MLRTLTTRHNPTGRRPHRLLTLDLRNDIRGAVAGDVNVKLTFTDGLIKNVTTAMLILDGALNQCVLNTKTAHAKKKRAKDVPGFPLSPHKVDDHIAVFHGSSDRIFVSPIPFL